MPTYDYKCEHCGFTFEKNVPIKDMDKPTEEPCSECGEKSITRVFGAPLVNLSFRGSTIQSHSSDGFKDILKGIKNKYGKNLTKGIE